MHMREKTGNNRMSFIQRKLREHMIRNGDLDETIPTPIDTNVLNRSAFGSRRRPQSQFPKGTENGGGAATAAAAPPPPPPNSSKIIMIQDLDNPYIKEALSRLVVRDVEKRKVIGSVFTFLISRLIKAILVILIPTTMKFESHGYSLDLKLIGSTVEWVLYPLVIWNLAVSIYRLTKPVDKCLDLPLTSQQRELIGLPKVQRSEDDDEDEADYDEQVQVQAKTLVKPVEMDQPVQIKLQDLDINEMARLNISSSTSNGFNYNKMI